jgi:hypothetical protein
MKERWYVICGDSWTPSDNPYATYADALERAMACAKDDPEVDYFVCQSHTCARSDGDGKTSVAMKLDFPPGLTGSEDTF